jgi:hypothetical protein
MIKNGFVNAASWLVQHGKDLISGLFTGILGWITSNPLTTWVTQHIFTPITNAIKSVFGISSPAKKMMPIGRNLIAGVIQGMIYEGKHFDKFFVKVFGSAATALGGAVAKGIIDVAKLPAKALSALKGIAGSVGGLAGKIGSSLWNFLTGGQAGSLNVPFGTGSTAGEMANGRQLYNYLLQHVFGGNKVAAAGATASIWGESSWNPFAVGTGGRGLIGWTPMGTISDASFKGGMKTQLPAIVNFIGSSGDWGVINQMKHAKSVTDAAWMWGKGVERYGIPDVHPEGLKLASSFMDQGGWLPPGASMVYNMTGKPELVLSPDQIAASMGTEYHAHFDGLTLAVIESQVRTAFHMMSLTQGNLARQGRRS